MNIDYFLPKPTEEELNYGSKVDYFERIINGNYQIKYKITDSELFNWIHHNYQAVFLLDQELSLTQLRKLK